MLFRSKKNGDVYTGDFEADNPDGMGRYVFANGDVYEGEIKQGALTGNGKKIMKSGVYEGEFLNGAYHGMGKFTGKNGLVRYGVWHHGSLANQLPLPEEGEDDPDENESGSEEKSVPEKEENGENPAE